MGTIRSDEQWLALTDSFQAAAFGGDWLKALAGLAEATGSRAGELIVLAPDNVVPLHYVSEFQSDWLDEFKAVGGGDPAVNPYVRHGAQARVMQVLQSADYIKPEQRRKDAFLTGFLAKHDVPYICQTPLIKEPGRLVGLAAVRSACQGEITSRQREIFTALAWHVRAAVLAQSALADQGALLVTGALEALSLAAFVCDRRGAVRAMTPAAEALISGEAPLKLKAGVLTTYDLATTRTLDDAILGATNLDRPAPPALRSVLIRGKQNPTLLLDVFPMPQQASAFAFEPRALVVARGRQRDKLQLRTLIQAAYNLTQAEGEVALLLAEGHSPEAVAELRGTSLGTTRCQIRALYAKFDVCRLSELISRVHYWA